MTSLVLPVVALFVSVALLIAGNGLLGSLVAVRLELEGFPALDAGAILALYSAGFVAGTLVIEPVVRRVGHIRAFAAFAATVSACSLVFPLLVSTWGWVLLRLRPQVPVAEQQPAVMVVPPAAKPVIAELDPRIEADQF